MSRTWRRPATCWSSGSPSGTSTAASKGRNTNVNLHVYSPGCPEIERYLVFRDRLRGHPDERVHYQRVKRELSERDWTYVQQYADAKTEVVESIIGRAQAATAGG